MTTGPWWNDEKGRGILYQLALALGVAGLGWFLVSNTLGNLHARNIATGFGYLEREAAFGISEHLIDYAPTDSYARALTVGLLNTLQVSLLGIILATLLGVVMGVARLSRNWLVGRLATVYVEAVRNVPLLLQLFFWYQLITEGLPGPRQAFNLFDHVFLSNRGLKLPAPVWDGHWGLAFDLPHLAGFNFVGGLTLSPELAALLAGLVVYTGAFIAEIVRGGILAVPHGQTEAALALGLSRFQLLRLVVLPQSLRVILPPMTSQYLNLAKNSTLAVAIGYPDLVSVGNTAINQTGQAVEGVALIMGTYLLISLGLSGLMNWYNKRIALRGGAR